MLSDRGVQLAVARETKNERKKKPQWILALPLVIHYMVDSRGHGSNQVSVRTLAELWVGDGQSCFLFYLSCSLKKRCHDDVAEARRLIHTEVRQVSEPLIKSYGNPRKIGFLYWKYLPFRDTISVTIDFMFCVLTKRAFVESVFFSLLILLRMRRGNPDV